MVKIKELVFATFLIMSFAMLYFVSAAAPAGGHDWNSLNLSPLSNGTNANGPIITVSGKEVCTKAGNCCSTVGFWMYRSYFDYKGQTSSCGQGNWTCISSYCSNQGYSSGYSSGMWFSTSSSNWFNGFTCYSWKTVTACAL